MAKKAKKERSPEPKDRSVLEGAFLAYTQGDMVTARKGARMVLDGPQPADEEYAKHTLASEMFVGASEAGAKEVAAELLKRTGVFPKAYLLGGLAAAIYVLMLFIASRY
jgi:hypothetical protein